MKGTDFMKRPYNIPDVQVSALIHPASMLCVSFQYQEGGEDPIYAV